MIKYIKDYIRLYSPVITQNIVSNQNINWHFPEHQIKAGLKEWVSLGVAFSGSSLVKG